MSNELKIFIIVISCIFGIIFILDILIFINVVRLKKRIKRKEITINSLMAQHYDLTMLLGKLLIKNEIPFSDELMISLDLHEKKEMRMVSTVERLQMKTIMTKTVGALLLLADASEISDEKEYVELKHSMEEFHHQYRQETILYNQDIYAYNYWIRFWSFALIAFIFHMRKKEPIQ